MNKLSKFLIAITGTTGVGKSQLAIDLANRLNGEIINADALQVYKGYGIITNKVTKEETQDIPHHLLGFIEPNKEYTVQEFEKAALNKIDEIHQRNKIPILVGGTNYYIQSVMFKNSLIRTQGSTDTLSDNNREDERYLGKSNQELWEELKIVDPVMAENWHPNNRRKILRSLEVYNSTGRKHSEWIKQGEEIKENQETLRYPTLLFWLYADPQKLNQRLDNRVEDMIHRGMFDELKQLSIDLHTPGSLKGSADDFTSGLKQAIGFREFKPYFQALSLDSPLKECTELREKGVEDMKTSTRRYAKRQISWIRNKLLPECYSTKDKSIKAHAYALDATDLNQWSTQVLEKGLNITKSFINNEQLPDPSSLSDTAAKLFEDIKDKPNSILSWKRYKCSVCSQTAEESRDGSSVEVWLNGEAEYSVHLRSRLHKKNVAFRKRLADGLVYRGDKDIHVRKRQATENKDGDCTKTESTDTETN